MRPARLACLVCLTLSSLAHAEDWPQWRGPTGQGLASTPTAPTHWSETQNIAWKTKVHGKGWSSPVILGDEIWLTTADEKPDTQAAEGPHNRLPAMTARA